MMSHLLLVVFLNVDLVIPIVAVRLTDKAGGGGQGKVASEGIQSCLDLN